MIHSPRLRAGWAYLAWSDIHITCHQAVAHRPISAMTQHTERNQVSSRLKVSEQNRAIVSPTIQHDMPQTGALAWNSRCAFQVLWGPLLRRKSHHRDHPVALRHAGARLDIMIANQENVMSVGRMGSRSHPPSFAGWMDGLRVRAAEGPGLPDDPRHPTRYGKPSS
jgi:hypothetical protein